MKPRMKRLKRLLDIQRKMKRLNEWKISDIQFQKHKVREEKNNLVYALSLPHVNGVLLTELISKKLNAISKQSIVLDSKYRIQEKALESQHSKVVQIEKVYEKIRVKVRGQKIEQDLLELIEISLAAKNKKNQASRKLDLE